MPGESMRTAPETQAGALLFARFAYPPNSLGLCGPDDSHALLEHVSTGVSDGGLRQLARGFSGAWPYLELIAAANNIRDPLDVRVVEAYWIGNPLLEHVPNALLGGSLEQRFRRRAGHDWSKLSESLEVGARPHHNFHVYSIYPWVGLLARGHATEPLRVLDRCRIRWGRVEQVIVDRAVVRSSPLQWTGTALTLGVPEPETVLWERNGHALADPPKPGDWVALHWDWLCGALTPAQLRALRSENARQLGLVNRGVAHPAPMAVLA
ncbi:MAG TPA: DUF6390 family protein [Candidatus Dormibacteraeota bacterium]|nr:DUF6390 family protein [Candidatus Dormibacteraeota bacterium]